MTEKTQTPVDEAKATMNKKMERVHDAVEESKQHGVLGKIKGWWTEHVAKNKAKAEAGKDAKGDTDGAEEGSKPKENTSFTVVKDDVSKLEGELDIEGDDAEFDFSKLSKEEKKALELEEGNYQDGLATMKDLIAPSSMEVQSTTVRLGDVWTKSFYVFSYPRFIETNWMAPIVNFDVTMDISMFMYPKESAAIMKVLRKKVAQFRSSMRMDREKGVVEDPALETALEDAERLRRDLQRGKEKFFQFGLYFTLYSESEDQLDKVSKQLESILGGKLILTKRADMQMDHALTASLPYCLDELEMMNNMNTGPLSTTFPFTSSELTSNEGILYGLNRHNDSLIIFDRFQLENANSVIFAKSGAGKSYTVKLEILRSLMMGTDVLIIDPENEYQTLCESVGGTYVKVSLSSQERINPFDLPAPMAGEIEKPGDRLRENVISLSGLMRLMMGKISDSESGILDKALLQTYESKGITMKTEAPEKMEPPTMEDFKAVLEGMKGAKKMVDRIEKYVTGTFSGIFNQQTNVDLNSGMIVFSIRDLEDELRPIASYIVLNFVWNKIRSELKRRIMIIDEAWIMMQHEDSAKFLFGLAKRARKYYLGMTTITQDVEDFLKSDYGKPIVSNSSMQILLKQSTASIDALEKIFNLTQGERYLLLNSGVGQGLFFAGNKHVAIQVIASYGEDKLCTTKPQDAVIAQQEEVEDDSARASEPIGMQKSDDKKEAAEGNDT
jgi:conjugal transfer ATP-binding protein TraC